jgi:hypothetical protein
MAQGVSGNSVREQMLSHVSEDLALSSNDTESAGKNRGQVSLSEAYFARVLRSGAVLKTSFEGAGGTGRESNWPVYLFTGHGSQSSEEREKFNRIGQTTV